MKKIITLITIITIFNPQLGLCLRPMATEMELNHRIASQFYDIEEDQLEISPKSQPLLLLQGKLKTENKEFTLNGKIMGEREKQWGWDFHTNFCEIVLILGEEKNIRLSDAIDDDFFFGLVMPNIGAGGAIIDEIFVNTLLSYLTREQINECRERADNPMGLMREFFKELRECDLDIDIIFEYYTKSADYPEEIRIRIVNNRPLSITDKQRIQQAFSVFRSTQETEERTKMLIEKGIWTENSGRGLVGIVEYLNDASSVFDFIEYSDRTEQTIRLISPWRFFKENFIKQLQNTPQPIIDHNAQQAIAAAA